MTQEQAGEQPGKYRAENVGSASEEAAKLMGALGDWAKDQRSESANAFAESVTNLITHATAMAGDIGRGLDQHVATGSAECVLCPVCRTVHVVREATPEVRTHLASAAASLFQAGAALMNAIGAPPAHAPEEQAGLEKIDLTDDWED